MVLKEYLSEKQIDGIAIAPATTAATNGAYNHMMDEDDEASMAEDIRLLMDWNLDWPAFALNNIDIAMRRKKAFAKIKEELVKFVQEIVQGTDALLLGT